LILGLALALFLPGCSESVSSGRDWEIRNFTDDFQFLVTDLKNYDDFLQYVWTNTGTHATVSQSSSITGGDAVVKIVDAVGTPVYGLSLKNGGTFTSAVGTPGEWTIIVRLIRTDGTLNFRVQKAP
jgi:hypothetical protein